MSRRSLVHVNTRKPAEKPGVTVDVTARTAETWSGPPVALALGGGGARGLSHIAVLEVLDELGIRPVAISGTSIGAVFGAAYAAGLSGRRIRQHMLDTLRDPTEVFQRLLGARVGRIADLFQRLSNPILVDGEIVLRKFWPAGLPERFEDLEIPFTAVAGDLMSRSEVRMSSGQLLSAVAGSMAIPGLVRPVQREEHLLVDGFVVNPVPVDLLKGVAPIIIAVDLQAAENQLKPREAPKNPYDALLQAAQIMELTLSVEKFRVNPPTIHVIPDVARFGSLEFFSIRDILKAADPLKADLTTRLRAYNGAKLTGPAAKA